ncbi:hypothetical protein KI387_014613, partial [Taxus chinensis]
MLFMSKKKQCYSYNHAWSSMNGPLEVLHMKENYEEDASIGRELNDMYMRHDKAVEKVFVGALDFICMFVLCVGPEMEKIGRKRHKCGLVQHVHMYEKQSEEMSIMVGMHMRRSDDVILRPKNGRNTIGTTMHQIPNFIAAVISIISPYSTSISLMHLLPIAFSAPTWVTPLIGTKV